MKKITHFIIISAILTSSWFFSRLPTSVIAQDKLDWVKNKFGIHITSNPRDLSLAAKLLNSNGGDWSWITVVIRKDELNREQWQDFFDQCRRLHLIPIVRLATKNNGRVWQKPEKEEVQKIADFLNSLIWPIKNQFVIIYNEPNRADEWGGGVDPKNYFEILNFAVDYFHQLNRNFFIISAGLDLAAPQKPPQFFSAENFYRQGYLYRPQVFEKIDGIASHSYPNHGFIGSPRDWGKTSIRGYLWEINYLAQLGVKRKLPVFITETGWPHQEGIGSKPNFYSAQKVARLFAQAFPVWINDPQVVAITPFILNYPQPPFDHFSWINHQGKRYPQFDWLKLLEKPSQKPPREEKIILEKISFPFLVQTGTSYRGKVILKNKGQTIWGEEKFCLQPKTNVSPTTNLSPLCLNENQLIEPDKKVTIEFTIEIKEPVQDTIIFGWEKLPNFEIKKLTTIFPSHTIYRRKTGIWEKILSFLKNAKL